MTGLPTRSLDEKGWPSSVCDSKPGRGRPRSSPEMDGSARRRCHRRSGRIAIVPATSTTCQRRLRISLFAIIAVPRPSAPSETRTERRTGTTPSRRSRGRRRRRAESPGYRRSPADSGVKSTLIGNVGATNDPRERAERRIAGRYSSTTPRTSTAPRRRRGIAGPRSIEAPCRLAALTSATWSGSTKRKAVRDQ